MRITVSSLLNAATRLFMMLSVILFGVQPVTATASNKPIAPAQKHGHILLARKSRGSQPSSNSTPPPAPSALPPYILDNNAVSSVGSINCNATLPPAHIDYNCSVSPEANKAQALQHLDEIRSAVQCIFDQAVLTCDNCRTGGLVSANGASIRTYRDNAMSNINHLETQVNSNFGLNDGGFPCLDQTRQSVYQTPLDNLYSGSIAKLQEIHDWVYNVFEPIRQQQDAGFSHESPPWAGWQSFPGIPTELNQKYQEQVKQPYLKYRNEVCQDVSCSAQDTSLAHEQIQAWHNVYNESRSTWTNLPVEGTRATWEELRQNMLDVISSGHHVLQNLINEARPDVNVSSVVQACMDTVDLGIGDTSNYNDWWLQHNKAARCVLADVPERVRNALIDAHLCSLGPVRQLGLENDLNGAALANISNNLSICAENPQRPTSGPESTLWVAPPNEIQHAQAQVGIGYTGGQLSQSRIGRVVADVNSLNSIVENYVDDISTRYRNAIAAYLAAKKTAALAYYDRRRADIEKRKNDSVTDCAAINVGSNSATLRSTCSELSSIDRLQFRERPVVEVLAERDSAIDGVRSDSSDLYTQLSPGGPVYDSVDGIGQIFQVVGQQNDAIRRWIARVESANAAYDELHPKFYTYTTGATLNVPARVQRLNDACGGVNALFCQANNWQQQVTTHIATAFDEQGYFKALGRFRFGNDGREEGNVPQDIRDRSLDEAVEAVISNIRTLDEEVDGWIDEAAEKKSELNRIKNDIQGPHELFAGDIQAAIDQCRTADIHCTAEFEQQGINEDPVALLETLQTAHNGDWAALERYFADDYVPAAGDSVEDFEQRAANIPSQRQLLQTYKTYIHTAYVSYEAADASTDRLTQARAVISPWELSYPRMVEKVRNMQQARNHLCDYPNAPANCEADFTAIISGAIAKLGANTSVLTSSGTAVSPTTEIDCNDSMPSVCRALTSSQATLSTILTEGCDQSDPDELQTCVSREDQKLASVQEDIQSIEGFNTAVDQAKTQVDDQIALVRREINAEVLAELNGYRATINGLLENFDVNYITLATNLASRFSEVDAQQLCQYETSGRESCQTRIREALAQIARHKRDVEEIKSTINAKLTSLDTQSNCDDPIQPDLRATCRTNRQRFVQEAQAAHDRLTGVMANFASLPTPITTQQASYDQYLALHPEVQAAQRAHSTAVGQVAELSQQRSSLTTGDRSALTTATAAATSAASGLGERASLHTTVNNMQVTDTETGQQLAIDVWATGQQTVAENVLSAITSARDTHCVQQDEAALAECHQSYQVYLDVATPEVVAVRQSVEQINQLVAQAENSTVNDHQALVSIGYQLRAAHDTIQLSNQTLVTYQNNYVNQLTDIVASQNAADLAVAEREAAAQATLAAARQAAETAVAQAQQAVKVARKPHKIPAIRRFDIHNCTASSAYQKDTWCGFVAPSLHFQAGNINSQHFGARGALAQRRGKWEYGMLGQVDYNRAEGEPIEESYWLGAKIRYFMDEANAFYNELSYESTALQGYKYLIGNTTGIEHRSQWAEDLNVLIGLGLGVRNSMTTDDYEETDFIQDLRGQFAWAVSPDVTLNQLLTAQLGNFGDALSTYGSTTTVNTRLSDNLSMAYSFDANYKSQIPSGSRKLTTGGKVGLRYDF